MESMRNILIGLMGLGTLCLFSACGGSSSSSGGTCGAASACGGDILGTWKVSSSCIIADASSMIGNSSCPAATESTSGMKIAGTVAYSADKTYSSDFTISGNVVINLPASCLTQQGVTVTCAQLQQGLSSNMTSAFSSATCAESGGGCACTLALNSQVRTETGTYSTAAGTLTQTATGGTPGDSDYCVMGNTLTISPASGSTMMSSGVTGSVVLNKQ